MTRVNIPVDSAERAGPVVYIVRANGRQQPEHTHNLSRDREALLVAVQYHVGYRDRKPQKRRQYSQCQEYPKGQNLVSQERRYGSVAQDSPSLEAFRGRMHRYQEHATRAEVARRYSRTLYKKLVRASIYRGDHCLVEDLPEAEEFSECSATACRDSPE